MEINGWNENNSAQENNAGQFDSAVLSGEEMQNDGFNIYGDNDLSKDPDYKEFIKYETDMANKESSVDRLIWHHIYAIMNAAGAGSALVSSIFTFFGSFARETAGEIVTAILTVLLIAAYNGFVLYACIQVLDKKAIGVKYIRIKTIVDMVLNGLGTGLSILLIGIGCLGDEFGIYFYIIGIGMAIPFGIVFAIALITNIYYKKREHMFTK